MKKIYLVIPIAIVVLAGAAVGIYVITNQSDEIEINTNSESLGLITVPSDDFFSFQADEQDSLGVDLDTTFTLTAKDTITKKIIQDELSVKPNFAYKIESSDDNTFTLIPKKNLSPNTVYSFSIATQPENSTQQREYQWAYQTKDSFKITGTLPRDKANYVPLDSGIEITFSHENFYDYENYIEISPAINGRFEKYRKTLVFIPDELAPSTFYTVKVKKSLPLSESSEFLSISYEFQFETNDNPDQTGYLSFKNNFHEYPVSSAPIMVVREYDTGLSQLPVTVYKFDGFDDFSSAVNKTNTVPLWAYRARENNIYNAEGLETVLTFNAEIKKAEYAQYIEFPDTMAEGQYLVQTEFGETKRQVFLQISNISASFQGSPTNSFVWVNDTSTGQPIASAGVTFSGDDNFSTSTDTNGLAQFQTPSQIEEPEGGKRDQLHYFIVDKENKKLLIPVSEHYESSYFWGTESNRDYWVCLYTNRNLYSPTDAIKYWGVLKPRSGSDEINTVEMEFVTRNYSYSYDSQDTIIEKQTITLSEFGTYQGNFEYTNMAPGSYYLRLKVDDEIIISNYVNIQTYTKPPYKIEITTPERAIFEGDNAVFNISSTFFDGTPVVDLKLEYNSSWGTGLVTTNSNGEAAVTLATEFENGSWYPQYNNFSVHPTQTEVTDIIGDGYIYSFGPHYNIDVDSGIDGNITGDVNHISLASLNKNGKEFKWDYDGTPVKNATVHLDIYHYYYNKVETGTYYDFINKKTYKTYDYNLVENLVEQTDVATDGRGLFSYQFSPQSDNNYKVIAKVTDSDDRTAQTIDYVYRGSNSYYSNMYGSDVYHLVSDKNQNNGYKYDIGEEVKFNFFKNDKVLPQANANNFVYFKDHGGITDIASSSSPVYEFDFKQAHSPNIYVYGLYFDGRSYYQTPAENVIFDSQLNKLNIDVTPDKNEYLPGEEAKLSIRVTDANNQPVEAEVNVSIIDQALASIEWANPANILATLYNPLSASLTYSYSTHLKDSVTMAEGGGCFTGKTIILMADGDYKNIASVKVGDSILTLASPADNNLVPAKVTDKKIHRVNKFIIINNELEITPEHVVLLNNEWQPVGQAKIGDALLSSTGKTIIIDSIESHSQPTIVYNLATANYHTFIADNIYVHNEKGGVRENFQDIAYFDSIRTNAQGNATATFTLPDNITSWKTTVQALTKDLKAAGEQSALIVTKPFFVDVSMSGTYLASDKPTIKLRGYGQAMNANDEINYIVNYPDFNDQIEYYQGSAFESVEIPLPDLSVGQHKIKVTAHNNVLEDIIIKNVNIISTNLKQNVTNYYSVQENVEIETFDNSNATFTFMNKERGQYYNLLTALLWQYGDRLEQKISRYCAQTMLNNFFEEESAPENINFTEFQTYEGGLSILPYASNDILLSAKTTEVADNIFDAEGLGSYFRGILDNYKSNSDEITYALLGLANLGEPVLVDINNFIKTSDPSPELKLYLARGIANLGATEYANTLLQEILTTYAEESDPYIKVNLGSTQDDYTEYTYQAAIIAAQVSSPQASKLFDYALANRAEFQLNTLEQIAYMKYALPLLSAEPVGFTYNLDGKNEPVSIEKNGQFSLLLTPQQAQSISFQNLSGQAGLIVNYQQPLNIAGIETDDQVSISRTYSVGGVNTNTFSENDIVKITLKPAISNNALDTEYRITDYLPGGLKPLTKTLSRDIYTDQNFRYPYDLDGQAVRFWSGKPSQEFYYYAIVIGKGEYTAEPATIQGFIVKDSINFSNFRSITIE